MKQLILFICIATVLYVPISGFTKLKPSQLNQGEMPTVQAKRWLLSGKKKLDADLLQLREEVVSNNNKKSLLEAYRTARTEFKRIEFVLAYLDPELYNSYINGAPLPKLQKKVPDKVVIEPCGFQRLDELINEETLDVEATTTILDKLRKDLDGYSEAMVNAQLTDPVLFEAARFGVLRINTMGVSGFDTPGNTDFAIEEVHTALRSMAKVIGFYQTFVTDSDWSKWEATVTAAIAFTAKGSFESFDRVAFHREHADELWRHLLLVQKSLRVELPHQRHSIPQPVNYESESMFSNDFLSADFYAQFSADSRDPQRVELGKLLFFDPVLSGNNERACASCHQPDKGFTDGLPKSLTIDGAPGNRNAPTILNSIFAERFFHDMRVDHLSAQMDHVVLNPDEFNADYDEIVRKLGQSNEYKALFETAYGDEGITKNSVNHAVTRYVASLRSYNSPFDRFMRRETAEIDASVVRGYNLFSGKAACATCHFAPTFSGLVPPVFQESESEVLGVPEAYDEPYQLDPDQGRYMNHILMEQAAFYKNAFKTPTLRNIEVTGPYMHNGSMKTLEDVLDFYNRGGGQGLGLDVPHQTLPGDELKLSKREIRDIISFMKALTDTVGMNEMPTRLPHFEGGEVLNQRKVGGTY